MTSRTIRRFFVIACIVGACLAAIACSPPEQAKSLQIKLQRDLIVGNSERNLDQTFIFIRSIDVDRLGNIYLVDKKKVAKFDKSGNLLWTLDKMGQGPGEFQRVVCLALSSDGTLFVADQNNRKIMSFSGAGEFLAEFKINEGMPIRIDTDSRGCIYAAFIEGNTNYLLHKYSRDGELINAFIEKGYKDEKNSLIRSARNSILFHVDRSDNIYVVYKYKYDLFKYDTSGKLLAKWSRKLPFKPKKMRTTQPHPGWLMIDADLIAQDIAVDSKSNIYVCWGTRATGNGYPIDVFSAAGKLLGQFYSGVAPEEDHTIQFIHIDRRDNFYVLKTGSEPQVIRHKMVWE